MQKALEPSTLGMISNFQSQNIDRRRASLASQRTKLPRLKVSPPPNESHSQKMRVTNVNDYAHVLREGKSPADIGWISALRSHSSSSMSSTRKRETTVPHPPNVFVREEEKTRRKLKGRSVQDVLYKGNSSEVCLVDSDNAPPGAPSESHSKPQSVQFRIRQRLREYGLSSNHHRFNSSLMTLKKDDPIEFLPPVTTHAIKRFSKLPGVRIISKRSSLPPENEIRTINALEGPGVFPEYSDKFTDRNINNSRHLFERTKGVMQLHWETGLRSYKPKITRQKQL